MLKILGISSIPSIQLHCHLSSFFIFSIVILVPLCCCFPSSLLSFPFLTVILSLCLCHPFLSSLSSYYFLSVVHFCLLSSFPFVSVIIFHLLSSFLVVSVVFFVIFVIITLPLCTSCSSSLLSFFVISVMSSLCL